MVNPARPPDGPAAIRAKRPDRAADRLLWLRILISGLAMSLLIERALVWTGNINYIPSLLVIGTFTVPLSFVAFLYTRNRTPQVSATNLLICVAWGGVLGTVIAGYVEYQTLLRLGVSPTLIIGLIEEIAKLAIPAFLILGGVGYNRRRKNLPEIDAIVIGAAAGAGFAALESMGYGLVALLLSGGNINAATEVLLLRALTAPAAHIAWTALAADALWHLGQGLTSSNIRRFVLTFSGVVLLHTAWDSVTLVGGLQYIILGMISLGWLMKRIRRAAHEIRLPIARPVNQPLII